MEDVLISSLKNSKEYEGIIEALDMEGNIQVNGLLPSTKAHIAYSIFKNTSKQILYIANTEYEAKKIYEELCVYMKNKVEFLGSEEILFYNLDARDRKADARRLKTYIKLLNKDKILVVTYVEAITRKYIPKKIILDNIFKVRVGQNIDIQEFIQKLVLLGYQRVTKVEGFGQFSVRGGILDIFTLFYDFPLRFEFFDDEIDSIRQFNVYSQKSIEKMKTATITPSREIIYPKDVEVAAKKIRSEFNDITDADVFRNLERIERKEYFDGLENYIDYLYGDEDESIFEYLTDDSMIFIDDINRLKERFKNINSEFRDNYMLNLERGLAIKNQGKLIYSLNEVIYYMMNKKIVINSLLPKAVNDMNIIHSFNIDTREIPGYGGRIDLFVEELKRLRHSGYKIVIATGSSDRAKKLSSILNENNVENIYSSNRNLDIKTSQIVVTGANISQGFQYPSIKFQLITDREIVGANKSGVKKKKKKQKENSKKIDSFLELKVGDYVVHENSGVGKYTGIEQISVNNIKKDYLKVVYQGGDNLYVPIDQMDKVQKYIGGDVEKVKLNKLGSQEWSKAKNKVRKQIEDMTKELIELYAKREGRKGYKFSKDTIWQQEFEEKFPFQETDDQLKAIKETKKDMETSKAMDRLICGDVGYGKTEVAIRAAFKAVMDGKQVAILVPTTILAQQHFNTFSERYEDYPIRVEALSRFKTPKQQKDIIEDANKGLVDIIIGTHRIVSKDINMPKLGLVVIDEEQRFGVRHKEKLKQIKENVDVLTLSATPIPRTLHMSLSGIRDMSIIEEPPQERYPVMTYVTEAKDSIIQDEIHRELARGGQVFFVYNRIEGIEELAARIRRLVPDARVGVAHGRMSSNQLENTVLSFLTKEFDVLVCTTIIETGMDIANANTVIIYDADKMGLSQLYQLRGRVGRSTRQGYAYLMYERNKILSEVAEKRLKAIKEFTEFGSGFKIAMRDLEIRGAGDVLGAQQHGHMAVIGYELYVKMLNEAIAKVKGQEVLENLDVEIDLSTNAYIPSTYIEDEIIKLEMYKKIATIDSKEDMYEIQEELEDRFSDIPKETQTLLNIAYIKSLCKRLKIEKVKQVKNTVILEPLTKYETSEVVGHEVVMELETMLEGFCKNLDTKQ
ncbi:transcription-repair coupling factor [Peptostreptococcus canis]|uniref:Transcription-repair-coupling factor n=1 Tax=Peptostreptococcus canis TaxID=1159213 RepID=A0ABR6TLR0_9FIRM|nr:transcription-repair coupling factor [Peptostreptococcus canis]MBC2576346.1 transcription-repair coupling factor [Peptostreptococcus canis]MBP1998545.1 transcription-repair coupling factor (superfamily II helicase) [Peptostreptococcus canis]